MDSEQQEVEARGRQEAEDHSRSTDMAAGQHAGLGSLENQRTRVPLLPATEQVRTQARRISDLETAVAASDAFIHCLRDLEHGRRRDDRLDRERDWQRTRTLV